MSEFMTEDRKCGRCGATVEGFDSEPADEVAGRNGWMVTLSVWKTLRPCGCVFKQATGATLD